MLLHIPTLSESIKLVLKEGSGPVYITAHVGTEIVNPSATATTTITTEIVNDMDDASMGDEELEDSELTSETSPVKMLKGASEDGDNESEEEKVESHPAKKKKTADAPAPKVCQFPLLLFSR